MNKLISLLPLRGGSKSIPDKNIKMLAGKPLCAWSLEAACKAAIFDKVIVSTDSERIADVVNKLGLPVDIIMRPPHLATDDASTESVMLHVAERVDFKTLVTIQATSPLTRAQDFINAYQKYQQERLDSLLTCVRIKRFFWSDDGQPLNYDPHHRPMRQTFHGTLMENGAFYITAREILEKYLCRLGGRIGCYEMEEHSAVEIDEPSDWLTVEKYLFEQKRTEIRSILE